MTTLLPCITQKLNVISFMVSFNPEGNRLLRQSKLIAIILRKIVDLVLYDNIEFFNLLFLKHQPKWSLKNEVTAKMDFWNLLPLCHYLFLFSINPSPYVTKSDKLFFQRANSKRYFNTYMMHHITKLTVLN